VRALAEFDRATGITTVYSETFKDPLSILSRRILRQAPPDSIPPVESIKPKKK
jgi:hypothetical protein